MPTFTEQTWDRLPASRMAGQTCACSNTPARLTFRPELPNVHRRGPYGRAGTRCGARVQRAVAELQVGIRRTLCVTYSSRSASIGSTRAAREAGIQLESA